ncbi:MAG: hypothetical protein JKY65_02390 [Planctomycetes bacterium]|nr:hypothetical protein [Planctomycetota bacterium]
MSTSRSHRPTTLALALAFVGVAASAALSEESAPDLVTPGTLKAVGDDFYELSYRVPQLKGRAKKTQAYVKITPSTEWFADRPGRLASLKKDSTVWLYGLPVEAESQTKSGQTVVDRQIRGTLAVVSGPGVSLREGKAGTKGPRWVKATISKAGQAVEVSLGGNTYRVLTVRGCPVVLRIALSKRPKKLKKKLLAAISANKTDARPTKNKADWVSFEAKQIFLLTKRLGRAYALMASNSLSKQ